jgi:pyruvate/2-oxoglutarate dehydrogenase complex dihydrolipoamide dehydrogenase (E3) component
MPGMTIDMAGVPARNRRIVEKTASTCCSTLILGVEGSSGQGLTLRVRDLKGSDLLVAVGRIPSTHGMGLERTDVGVDERGYIRVNERLRTSVRALELSESNVPLRQNSVLEVLALHHIPAKGG